jgi:hypothetical protein
LHELLKDSRLTYPLHMVLLVLLTGNGEKEKAVKVANIYGEL